ncbi:MAG TPA: 50S ribosomal protein L25 [Solirubrobacteraceae bacterium]|nr:50S ribosomal protein L25 [Solirubrobacteraceae bacterium]
MAQENAQLQTTSREPEGSRAARRLRREGRVPGVLYGGSGEAIGFHADARELRVALAASSAVIEVSVDGGRATPAVLKEAQRHPVRGEVTHIDLMRVRLDEEIHAVVPIELLNAEQAAGAKLGGILEQITREVNVEALPTAIPESITYDVAELEIGQTVLLEAVAAPAGVKILDDVHDTVVALMSAPRLQATVEEEIESETEVVGEEEPAAEDAAAEE